MLRIMLHTSFWSVEGGSCAEGRGKREEGRGNERASPGDIIRQCGPRRRGPGNRRTGGVTGGAGGAARPRRDRHRPSRPVPQCHRIVLDSPPLGAHPPRLENRARWAAPSPASLDAQSLAAMLSSSDEPLAKRLVASVLGLSPPLAAEVVVRAGLNPEAPARGQSGAAARLWETLQEVVAIVAHDAFASVVYYDGSAPVGFAPFLFKSLAELRPAPASSMSEAVEMVLGPFGAAARLQGERAALLAAVRAALERVERTAAEVQRAVEEAERTGKLRQHGELLLAYASQIPPRVPHVTLPGFDGAPVTINLDPTLSAVENAQRLFKRYGRVRSARPALEARLPAAADERAYLESARALIEQASSSDDLFDLRRELADEGYVRARKTPARPSATPGPRRFVLADGTTTVLVGRTNHENDVLTFKVASPDDIWLHARGTPGARSEEHTSELQSRLHLVCRLLLEKKNRRPRMICSGSPATRTP